MKEKNNPPVDAEKQPPAGPPVSVAAESEGFHNLKGSQVFVTLGGVMLAMFLSSLDSTIVSTAMPRIIADLKGFEHYTWVSTAYLLTYTAVMPIVGRLTDMYGRKWFYIIGIIIFLLGSALCGLSHSMTHLIICRGFQGIGAGVMMANAAIVIGDLFPPSERGKYQGLTMAVFGLAAIVGPLLGGFITDRFSWHWIFYINLPLGIPVIVAFIRFFPNIQPVRVKHQLDYLGMAALVLCVAPLILGLSWAGVEYGWVSPQIIGMLAMSAVMVVVFIVVESRAAEPIMPLGVFRNRVVSVSVIASFCIGMGLFGTIFLVPLFFQGVLGQSATNSGIILMPMMLGWVVASTISGQALSRLGGHYRVQALVGLAVMAVGMFLLSRMTADSSSGQAVFDIVVMGLGLGIALPLLVIAVQNAVPYRIMGAATASVQFFRSIGQTVGLAIFGSIMASHFASNVVRLTQSDIKGVIGPDALTRLTSHPEALMDSNAMTQLRDMFGQQGADMAERFVHVLKESLAMAISDVFVVGTAALAVAFAVTLFLKEVPLRRSHKPEELG
ncbi:MAG: MDR family MFS transporter [Chloroflexi bacterium]|nr:MDR family MFS transporter [Chloroflexota bacterium]